MAVAHAHESFSIEAEDLVIQRLFDTVIFKDRSKVGFYLDIGAFHPIIHSNTYFFYRKGWRGVNVEPNPQYIAEFARERPDDVTINAGLSDKAGMLTYHMWEFAMLNGFYGQDVIDYQIGQGQKYLGAKQVECLATPDFLARYATREIDFINLDIETQEPPVLRTWDWVNKRPKLICIEIHGVTMADTLKSAYVDILGQRGYTLMSRVWQSVMFVDNKFLT
jgi:FkbM family methyltransferase